MNHSALTLTALFSLLTLAPPAPAVQDEKPLASQVEATSVDRMAREATRIADQYVAELAHSFPEQAEISGLPIPNHDSISDNSPKGLRAWEALEDRWARELAKINPNALIGRPEWVTLGFVKEAVESSRQLRVCHYELWPVNQLNGWQAGLLLLLDSQPVGTDKARAEALTRWGQLPSYLDNEIANLREGVRRGYTSPQHNVELVIEQLTLLTAPTEQTPFWSVARRDSSTLFQERWKTLVTQRIKPAIERYRSYLQEEYLKRARVPIALTANRDGAACYDASFRSYTTIRRPGTETFELGQREVERNRNEALDIGREAFGTADLKSLIQHIREDPANHFSSRDERLAFARDAVARAQTHLSERFSRLPRAAITVEPFGEMLEKSSNDGYLPGAQDGSRPATYRVTLYRFAEVTRSTSEISAFHETYPGHHLQNALAQEQPAAHSITVVVGNSGFSEGWARYAEVLAEEMGMYSSPYARATWRLWAGRGMVVDPGIHLFGWTREQAVAFISEGGRIVGKAAEAMVDRIAVRPAQLTAYDTGALEFFALRKQAQDALGTHFDIREFHEVVLGSGSVTLPMLRQRVERWLAERRASK